MIDFDRSGSQTPDSGLRRSWGLGTNGKACQSFRSGVSAISAVSATGSTDLIRFDGRLYGFWMAAGKVYAKSAALGLAGNKSCAGSANPEGSINAPCVTWEHQQVLLFDTYVGFSVLRFGNRVFLALTHTDQHIEVRRYDVDPSSQLLNEVLPSWNLTDTQITSKKSTQPPELTLLHDSGHSGDLAVIYRSQDSAKLYLRQFQPATDNWANPTALIDTGGANITSAQGPAALAWPGPDASAANAQRRTLAVFPTTAAPSLCRFYILDPNGSNKWQRIANSTLDALQCDRQPGIALRTRRTTTGLSDSLASGHLMITHSGVGPGVNTESPWVSFTKLFTLNTPPSSTKGPAQNKLALFVGV